LNLVTRLSSQLRLPKGQGLAQCEEPMLPRSLLAALVLYFPTLLAVGEVEFSSRLQLIPFDGDDTSFPSSYPLPPFSSHLKTRPITVYRPRSLDVLHNARLRSLQHRESAVEQPIWDPVQVEGPDVEDMHTLSQLARMSGNAYALPGRSNWYEVDKAWNKVCIL
jgi:lipase ATG15